MADFTTTTHAVFIPEHWADEVQVSYEGKVTIVNLVKKETFGTGKQKGDILHFPIVTSLTAKDIAENSDIEGEAPTESEVTVTLNKQKHASVYVPKHLGENFSKYDLRSLYMNKVGAALAKQLDVDLLTTLNTVSNSIGAVDGSATDVTDTYIRDAMELLDEADVPEEERSLVFYPDQKSAIFGIAKFLDQQTVGDASGANQIRTGKVADIYGMPVAFTTNFVAQGTGNDQYHIGFMIHPETAVLAIPEMGPDISYDWIPRRKAFLLSGDMLYGSALFRAGNGVKINTNT